MVCEFCVLFAQESSLMLEEYGSELFILTLFLVFVWGLNDLFRMLQRELINIKNNNKHDGIETVNVLLRVLQSSEEVKQELAYLRQDLQRIDDAEYDKEELLKDQMRLLEDVKFATESVGSEVHNVLTHLEVYCKD